MPRRTLSRRDLLRSTAAGAGAAVLAGSLPDRAGAGAPLAARPSHFAARAKRVIFLFMEGGPSAVDTFDFKPELNRRDGEPIPPSAVPRSIREGKGEDPAGFGPLKGAPARFRRRGESGLWVSDLLPHVAGRADDLCVLNGVVADSTEHGTATQQMHTGLPVLPRPSLGAWLLYGLGSENPNLPGFVAVSPPAGSAVNCGTNFLPGVYQSTILRDAGAPGAQPVRHLGDPRLPRAVRRRQLQLLQQLNREHAAAYATPAAADPTLDSLIEANELAFRMQSAAPEVLDLNREDAATRALYGIDEKPTDAFGRQCLLARRLSEAGVRFVQVTSKGWDHHDRIDAALPASCRGVDKPIAGLLTDLKRRGLLEDTLVVWSGEFGRTPVSQRIGQKQGGGAKNAKPPGRGHNPFGFSLFLAGGGAKAGFSHGETDPFGYSAVAGRVHVHDLHATLLHLLGLDHERLTYRHGGRDYRLTDVAGRVVHEIVA